MRSLLVVALCVVAVLARRLPEEDEIGGPIPLCSDGKGALLEAGRVYKCSQTCPDGFFCEFRDEAKTLERGICCPDLAKLYQIYGDDASDQEDAKVFEVELRRKGARSVEQGGGEDASEPREEVVVDLMKLEEVMEGDGATRKLETPTTTDSLPTPGALPLAADSWSTPGEVLTAKTILEGKNYSCERQEFELTCQNGTLPTQFTLRWFAKDGKCCSYPYGFCPGNLIVNDNKIRTKKDCEEYCLKPSVQYAANAPREAGIDMNFDAPQPLSRIPTQDDMENLEKLKQKACSRSTPYRDSCPGTNMPSQFVLRWYVKDGMCCSYPYGYCHGDSILAENLIRTKESCEKHCLKNTPVSMETLVF